MMTEKEKAICAVIDMTCAVYEGDISTIKSLLADGFPVDTCYYVGLATQSLLEFSIRYGNEEVKNFVFSYGKTKVN